MKTQVAIHKGRELPVYHLAENAKELNRPLTTKERAQHAEDVVEIKRSWAHFLDDTCVRLARIRDTRSYRETHGTFEQFCLEVLDVGDRRGRQLAAAGEIFRNLIGPPAAAPGRSGQYDRNPGSGASGTSPQPVLPTSERQLRPLAGLPKEEQREIWKEAVEESDGKVPTTKVVEEAVERRRPPAIGEANLLRLAQCVIAADVGEQWTINKLAAAYSWSLDEASRVWDYLCDHGLIVQGKIVPPPGRASVESATVAQSEFEAKDFKKDQIMGAANKAFRCMQSLRNLIEPWLLPALEDSMNGLRAFADAYQEGPPKPKTKSKPNASGVYVICRKGKPGAGGAGNRDRYDSGGGWTVDPSAAKKFTSAELRTTKRKTWDRPVALRTALARFRKAK